MNADEIHKIVTEVLIEDLGLNPTTEITPDTTFEELNFDSLGLAQLALGVEDRFERDGLPKINLMEADFEHNAKVSDFVAAVTRQLS